MSLEAQFSGCCKRPENVAENSRSTKWIAAMFNSAISRTCRPRHGNCDQFTYALFHALSVLSRDSCTSGIRIPWKANLPGSSTQFAR